PRQLGQCMERRARLLLSELEEVPITTIEEVREERVRATCFVGDRRDHVRAIGVVRHQEVDLRRWNAEDTRSRALEREISDRSPALERAQEPRREAVGMELVAGHEVFVELERREGIGTARASVD